MACSQANLCPFVFSKEQSTWSTEYRSKFFGLYLSHRYLVSQLTLNFQLQPCKELAEQQVEAHVEVKGKAFQWYLLLCDNYHWWNLLVFIIVPMSRHGSEELKTGDADNFIVAVGVSVDRSSPDSSLVADGFSQLFSLLRECIVQSEHSETY